MIPGVKLRGIQTILFNHCLPVAFATGATDSNDSTISNRAETAVFQASRVRGPRMVRGAHPRNHFSRPCFGAVCSGCCPSGTSWNESLLPRVPYSQLIVATQILGSSPATDRIMAFADLLDDLFDSASRASASLRTLSAMITTPARCSLVPP